MLFRSPQASIKYQINDANSLKLNYTTSISRPGISYLNPAVSESPEGFNFGNDHLTSSHQQSLTLLYMYVSPRLTLQLAPMYRFYDGGIREPLCQKEENKTKSTAPTIISNAYAAMKWKPICNGSL